jgi:flagellar capping protein FliD
VELLAKDTSPVNITVIRPTAALSDALTKFRDAYNAATDEVDKQHGNSNGPLAGQSLVGNLSRALSSIGTYAASSGQIGNLADLGLELDKTGHFTFNSFTLLGHDLTGSTAVTAFLGSATSGFLKSVNNTLTGVEDTTSGLIPTAQAAVTAQGTAITDRITDTQARVDAMVESMTEKMAAADALVSSMEQQYNYMASLFQSMSTAATQYK